MKLVFKLSKHSSRALLRIGGGGGWEGCLGRGGSMYSDGDVCGREMCSGVPRNVGEEGRKHMGGGGRGERAVVGAA